jgi:oligoribonuclease (3'-5' exoribonuclease)
MNFGNAKINQTAENRWKRFNIAFLSFQAYIANKQTNNKFNLTIIDLLYTSNFKGGNASIIEKESELSEKLIIYSKTLKEIDTLIGTTKLACFSEEELKPIINKGLDFLKHTEKDETKISGFGVSYASALMCAYFPDVMPIIDRRVLKSSGIKDVISNSQKGGQAKNPISDYENLIIKFYEELKKYPEFSLREQDKIWFSKES